MRSYVLLGVFIVGYIVFLPVMDGYSKARLADRDIRYIPHKELIEVSSLEFRNIVSDMLFLNTLSFVGGRTQSKEDLETWGWLYKTLDASSYLNPYNMDPYFIAEGFLTWHGKMFRETNSLLERGMQYRTNDWIMPFFIGFNYYYFLNDPDAGAKYIEQAAQRPGTSRTTLIALASRLYVQSAQTELAIALVKDDSEKTKDENLRIAYQARLNALYARLYVEQAVEAYKKVYRKNPASIDVLISKNYLSKKPISSEGGEFFLDKDGRVRTAIEIRIEKRAQMYR